jgi:hypothetical protein
MNGRFITSNDIRMECGKIQGQPEEWNGRNWNWRVGSAPNPTSGCFYDDISNIKVGNIFN